MRNLFSTKLQTSRICSVPSVMTAPIEMYFINLHLT